LLKNLAASDEPYQLDGLAFGKGGIIEIYPLDYLAVKFDDNRHRLDVHGREQVTYRGRELIGTISFFYSVYFQLFHFFIFPALSIL
jgi:hypothetical protein